MLLLAVLHRSRELRALVSEARSLGLEPFVEAHDARELDRAIASDALLIGINNRDLGTLEVDVTRAEGLRASVPDDLLVVAESGVSDPSTLVRWRALGFDAALIGEALMRAQDPAAATAAFVAAGRMPVDLAAADREPHVKICGIVDEDGVAGGNGGRRRLHRPEPGRAEHHAPSSPNEPPRSPSTPGRSRGEHPRSCS